MLIREEKTENPSCVKKRNMETYSAKKGEQDE